MSPNSILTPPRNVSPARLIAPRPNHSPHPPLKRDPVRTEQFLQDITRLTEGYTLEQLEQVYATSMDTIWRLRHEWDRTLVIAETEKCVTRVLKEIEMMKEERKRDGLDS